MMNLWTVGVLDDNDMLMFEENFQMNDFSIHFDDDETQVNGTVYFQPERRIAIRFWHSNYEDLSAIIDTLDLYETETGRELWESFHSYNIGKMYRAAKKYTLQIIEEMGL